MKAKLTKEVVIPPCEKNPNEIRYPVGTVVTVDTCIDGFWFAFNKDINENYSFGVTKEDFEPLESGA